MSPQGNFVRLCRHYYVKCTIWWFTYQYYILLILHYILFILHSCTHSIIIIWIWEPLSRSSSLYLLRGNTVYMSNMSNNIHMNPRALSFQTIMWISMIWSLLWSYHIKKFRDETKNAVPATQSLRETLHINIWHYRNDLSLLLKSESNSDPLVKYFKVLLNKQWVIKPCHDGIQPIGTLVQSQ